MWLQVPQGVVRWLVVTGVPLRGGAVLQQEQGDRQNLVAKVEIPVQHLKQIFSGLNTEHYNIHYYIPKKLPLSICIERKHSKDFHIAWS